VAHEALDIALELRDRVMEGYWLLYVGDAQQALGRCSEALTSYQRSATIHRRLGDRSREALAWCGAGRTYQRLERTGEAADFFRRAAAVHQDLGDSWHRALALDGLAMSLFAEDAAAARRHWGEALRLLADYGDARAVKLRERIEGRLARDR
jgi:tetratricopeptide (TPR) repeat protein